jgi:hypothetical protein
MLDNLMAWFAANPDESFEFPAALVDHSGGDNDRKMR